MKENEVLIQSSYGDAKGYVVSDLEDEAELYYILGEVYSHEADITKAGIEYLKHKYGWHGLANLLSQRGGLDDDARSIKQIETWLNNYERLSS